MRSLRTTDAGTPVRMLEPAPGICEPDPGPRSRLPLGSDCIADVALLRAVNGNSGAATALARAVTPRIEALPGLRTTTQTVLYIFTDRLSQRRLTARAIGVICAPALRLAGNATTTSVGALD